MTALPASASAHPPTWKFDHPIYHAETRTAWRAWLEANHATERGVWLMSWRNGTGGAAVPYPEAVEEALCFGWIDSTAGTFDDERRLQLMTDAVPAARAAWAGFPPSARKQMLWWVISAAKPDTRARRVVTIVAEAEHGRRAQG